jgi:hypothetical protein
MRCGSSWASSRTTSGIALPRAIQSWSLTSLRQRFFKTGGRLIWHARAESYLTPRLCRQILKRIERLAWQPT